MFTYCSPPPPPQKIFFSPLLIVISQYSLFTDISPLYFSPFYIPKYFIFLFQFPFIHILISFLIFHIFSSFVVLLSYFSTKWHRLKPEGWGGGRFIQYTLNIHAPVSHTIDLQLQYFNFYDVNRVAKFLLNTPTHTENKGTVSLGESEPCTRAEKRNI
jgi:hypothetical protein